MNLKSYTFFSFLYVCIVGVIVMFNASGEYSFSFFGSARTLPTAVWIILPLLILYAATLAHFLFYGLVNYLKMNSYKNDYETLLDQITNKLMGVEEEKEYKNPEFKTLADFVIQSDIKPKSRFKLNIVKVDKVAETLHQIEEGHYVDLAKFRLSKDNPIIQKNAENRLASDPKYAEDILKSCDKPTALCMKAYEAFAEFADLKQIRKIEVTPNKAVAQKIIARFAGDEKYELDSEYVKEICSLVKFTKDDYVTLAKTLVRKINPDEALEIFFILSRDNTEAMGAYIYVCLELEMTDKAKELLEQCGDDELLELRAFVALKNIGKNIRLSSFLEGLAGSK
jgi:hypothetical protein